MTTAQDMLAKYLDAEAKILKGQSARIGDRFLTKANLAEVQQGRREWERKVASEQGAASGLPSMGGLGYSLGRFDNPQ